MTTPISYSKSFHVNYEHFLNTTQVTSHLSFSLERHRLILNSLKTCYKLQSLLRVEVLWLMLKMVWPEVKQVLLNMNATLSNTNWTPFFPIKKLVQHTVSFHKDISLPSHSERNLNNLPNFHTMCLRDNSLKTGIGHNEMTFAECNIVVTVLRLIATNSLSIK